MHRHSFIFYHNSHNIYLGLHTLLYKDPPSNAGIGSPLHRDNTRPVEVIVNIEFPYYTNRRVKDFRFKCLEWLDSIFEKYISQIRKNIHEDSCFMQNHNYECKEQVQNIGVRIINSFSAEFIK